MRVGDVRGHEIIDSILSGVASSSDQYELLQLVFDGFPIEELRTLFESHDNDSVFVGVSILAEVAATIGKLPDSIDRLLIHEDERVRYYAIQAVLATGSASHGRASALSARMLDDDSAAVRRSSIRFLARAPEIQLQSAAEDLGPEWDRRIDLLVSSGSEAAAKRSIIDALAADTLDRRVALAAAVRHQSFDLEPLEVAARSEDAEISEFARYELEHILRQRPDTFG